jgi:polysaccharide biosynthesis protein PslH
MKILFVSALFPYPLYSGGQVRMYNLIRQLSDKHEITLFSFIRKNGENTYKKNMPFCRSITTVLRGSAWQSEYITRAITGPYPFLWSTYDNDSMRRSIEKELAQTSYDIIHLEPGYVWPSLPKTDIPLVVSEHNIESNVYAGYVRQSIFRFPLWVDVWKMAIWQRRIWKKAARVTAVSQDDNKYIGSVINPKKVEIINNGVDLPSFPYKPKNKRMSDAMTYLYVGNFSWIENQDAVKHLIKEIWPAIARCYPKATLRIVGKNLPNEIREMANTSNTFFFDQVEHIQTELQNADIMLAPIRIGGGTKYKLLEAMASGLPIITTKEGAEGLHARHNKELFIADTTKDILKSIQMIADSGWRLGVVSSARKRIEEEYSWVSIADQLDTVWREAYGEKH